MASPKQLSHQDKAKGNPPTLCQGEVTITMSLLLAWRGCPLPCNRGGSSSPERCLLRVSVNITNETYLFLVITIVADGKLWQRQLWTMAAAVAVVADSDCGWWLRTAAADNDNDGFGQRQWLQAVAGAAASGWWAGGAFRHSTGGLHPQ